MHPDLLTLPQSPEQRVEQTFSDLNLDLLSIGQELGFAIHHKTAAEETVNPITERAELNNLIRSLKEISGTCAIQIQTLEDYILNNL